MNAAYKVSLPKAFEEKFALYAPKEYELEALQVFTPDVLQYLLDTDTKYDIEIVDHEVVFIKNSPFCSLNTFQSELVAMRNLVGRFFGNVQHMQFIPIPNRPHLLREVAKKHGIVRGFLDYPLRYQILIGFLTIMCVTAVALIIISLLF